MSGSSLWRAIITKEYQGETWDNTYVINAASLAAAITAGQQVVAIEKAVHRSEVNFVRLYVTPNLLSAGGGTAVGLTGTGNLGVTAQGMPLFNTVRVWFRPASGKPSQKYLRLPLDEANQTGGVLSSEIRDYLQNNYVAPLLALSAYVDTDGQAFTSGAVYPRVQMRQLHWKRRHRPGQKRGWVPA